MDEKLMSLSAGTSEESGNMRDQFDQREYTIRHLVVHAGVFHADDVFCGALARTLNPNVVIDRVISADGFATDVDAGEVVADIGMGMFDHHQPDCPVRDDGIKHCAASRLWLVYGISAVSKTCGKEVSNQESGNLSEEMVDTIARSIYTGLLKTISAIDNGTEGFGKGIFTIADVVNGYRPSWIAEKTYEEGYFEAVELMQNVLQNEIRAALAREQARGYVASCIDRMDRGTVVLEKYCPWKEQVIAEKRAMTIVYPSVRGGWNVEPVPYDLTELSYRVKVPEAWRGLRDTDAGNKMEGMTFCHAKGFLLAFDTKEHAINAAHWLNEHERLKQLR